MPSSRYDVIPKVLDLVVSQKPKSILDVGAGFGKWGFLFREYLEVWQGNLYPKDWKIQIDAIEIFRQYTDLPWYKEIYNHITVADIYEYMKISEKDNSIDYYNLIMFGDVIEHLTKPQGKEILYACKNWIVVTPAYRSPQGEGFGNIHETHKSFWNTEDFDNYEVIKDRYIVAWRFDK